MIILNSPFSVNPFRQTFFIPADCPISGGSIPIFSIGYEWRFLFSIQIKENRRTGIVQRFC